jgi:hypothetical protein
VVIVGYDDDRDGRGAEEQKTRAGQKTAGSSMLLV